MNAELQTIPTGNITAINKLVKSTAALILQMLGYKINTTDKKKESSMAEKAKKQYQGYMETGKSVVWKDERCNEETTT